MCWVCFAVSPENEILAKLNESNIRALNRSDPYNFELYYYETKNADFFDLCVAFFRNILLKLSDIEISFGKKPQKAHF